MKPKKPIIGPETKKQAIKAAPKVPMTPAKTAEMKKEKRKETMAKVGAAIGTAAGVVVSEVRARQKQRGMEKYMNSNDPRIGTGQGPSNKELRQMGRGGLKKTK